MTDDPFEPFRGTLVAELRRVIAAVPHSHSAVLRDQMLPVLDAEDAPELLPGLMCLLTATSAGAKADAAMPAAVALTLLSGMGRVFASIAREAPDGSWGLPRTLNAGDGLYALAQTSILHSKTPAGTQRQMVAELDKAADGFSAELYEAAKKGVAAAAPSKVLLGAAEVLGALAAGGSADAAKIKEATAFIARVAGR